MNQQSQHFLKRPVGGPPCPNGPQSGQEVEYALPHHCTTHSRRRFSRCFYVSTIEFLLERLISCLGVRRSSYAACDACLPPAGRCS